MINGIPSKASSLVGAFVMGTLCLVTCFSSLIRQAESMGELLGIRVARQVPLVSHLLFTNDNILIFRVGQPEINKVT